MDSIHVNSSRIDNLNHKKLFINNLIKNNNAAHLNYFLIYVCTFLHMHMYVELY